MFSVQGLIMMFMFGYLICTIVTGIKDVIKYKDCEHNFGIELNNWLEDHNYNLKHLCNECNEAYMVYEKIGHLEVKE